METFTDNSKVYTKLENLKNWSKNPRGIKTDDFDRLKKQLVKLGQYKPLLVTQDGTVLGGNMRLRGYQFLIKELNELGADGLAKKYKQTEQQVEKVMSEMENGIWISVVNPKDDKEKLEYALSDNDRAGYYEMDSVLNVLSEYPDDDWNDYSIEIGDPLNIQELIEFENKSMDDLNKEVDPDELGKDLNAKCPRCGFEFEKKEQHDHDDEA